MPEPTWVELWTRWFNRHREARDPALPVGWYTIEELRRAFDAGAEAEDEHFLGQKTAQLIQILKSERP